MVRPKYFCFLQLIVTKSETYLSNPIRTPHWPTGGRAVLYLMFLKVYFENFKSCSMVRNFGYEMFEDDSEDTCGGKFPLMSMGGRAETLACTDPGARTPIGVGGIGPSGVRAPVVST